MTRTWSAAIVVADQSFGSPRAEGGYDLAPGVAEALDVLRARDVEVDVVPLDGRDASISSVSARHGPPSASLVVAADAMRRAAAADEGHPVAPHVCVAVWQSAGRLPRLVRIRAIPGRALPQDLLRHHTERVDGEDVVWGLLPHDRIAPSADAGFRVDLLPFDLDRHDLYLVRDPDPRVVALPAGTTDPERLGAGHGGVRLLLPEAALPARPARPRSRGGPPERPVPLVAGGYAGPTAAAVAADVARYSGSALLDEVGPVLSRHVLHPDSARVVRALLADLRDASYSPFLHAFACQGLVLTNVLADLPGTGPGLVLVGCHLDSTAVNSTPWDPSASPAPGADDDASGMACVLAAARTVHALAGSLTRTVRFCFFNAEEQGLVGSSAYAAHLSAIGAEVRAVLCVDMAGWNVVGSRTFEIHAGAPDPAVRDASAEVADVVARWAAATTTLGPAQIYRGTSPGPGTDPDLFDPAIGRADHAPFSERGLPAVVVSEDFFANPPGHEAAEPNPNYHRVTDTQVDPGYVGEIARALTMAVLELAR